MTDFWLEKIEEYEYENLHRSGIRIRHVDSFSRTPSQDTVVDQVNAAKQTAETKHPAQIIDEASDKIGPMCRSTGEEKEPITLSQMAHEAKVIATAQSTAPVSLYAIC